jgi:predicted transcriptional regulator
MYIQNEPRPATAEEVRGELRRVHGRPALTRDEDSARMMRRALDGSCNSARTLARFVERMSPTEAEALRVALRERLDS